MDNLSKEDWIEIHKKSDWNGNFKVYEMREFLDCPVEIIQETFKEYRGYFYRNSIVTCFDEFLIKRGFIKFKEFRIESDGFYPVKKQDIEIAPDVYRRCIVDGSFYLKKGDFKLVVEFSQGYDEAKSWYININYRKEDESQALDFLTALDGYAKEVTYLKKAKIDPDLEYIKLVNKYSWEDIILPANVKNEIQLNVGSLIESIDIYKANKLNFKRGLILKGVPGTGKTHLARILCQSVDCTFIWVTPKYLGRSSNVSLICDLAQQLSPSILFLEDIDLYSESRDTNANNSLLGELMNRLDGLIENHYVIVIATSNKPEVMEEALKNRPGRFDRIIDVPCPDLTGRVKMLELYVKDILLSDVDLNIIAEKTDGFTGAHIKELVSTAIMNAIDEKQLDDQGKVIVEQRHFTSNVTKVKNKQIQPAMGFGAKLESDDDDDDLPRIIPAKFE